MEDQQKAKLQATAEAGMIMRGFMNHPGFDIWHKDLQLKIEDVKKEWLTCDDAAKAEKIRTRAVQLNEALDLVKRRVVAGDNARKLLDMDHEMNLEQNQAPQNG